MSIALYTLYVQVGLINPILIAKNLLSHLRDLFEALEMRIWTREHLLQKAFPKTLHPQASN